MNRIIEDMLEQLLGFSNLVLKNTDNERQIESSLNVEGWLVSDEEGNQVIETENIEEALDKFLE